MRGIKIRGLIPEDLPDIYRLGLESFNSSPDYSKWTPEKIAETLIFSMEYSIVAARRRNILAFVIPELHEYQGIINAELRWIGTTKALKGRLEESVLEAMFERTGKLKINRWSAFIPEEDSLIHQILKKHGFSDNSELKLLKLDN